MKKMWLPVLLASALIVSCAKDSTQNDCGTGSLILSPAMNKNVIDITRSNTPLSDFTGYVLTLDGPNIEEMPCPADGKVVGLTPGDYVVGLTNLTDDFVPAFDAPRYGGTKSATVAAARQTPVAIVLTQANAGVKFVYDGSLTAAGLGDMTATVTQKGVALVYEDVARDATGYFAPGEVALSLESGGETVTIGGNASKTYTLSAGEVWTITLKTAAKDTGLTVSAEIDISVIDRTDEIEVDPTGEHNAKSRATIASFAGQTLTVNFTDGTTAAVKFNASGEADIKGATNQIIESILPQDGDPIYIGRAVGDDFTLRIENGLVVFRDADAQGRIPLGTRAEMDLLNDTSIAARLSGSYVQEGDIHLLWKEGDDIVNLKYPFYWYGIGRSSSNPFTGTYDGGGYKIYGVASRNNGLFGFVNDAVIKNVTVASGLLEGSDYTGGICGQAKGATRIENCANHARVSGKNSVGGIVGEVVSGTSSYVVVTGCVNHGAVSGSSATGGIAGFNGATGMGAVIERCANYGAVSSNGWGGGIAGNASGRISGCVNHGSVTVHGTYSGMAGGIAGRGFSIQITACYNTGDVHSANGAGGIVATFYKTTTGQAAFISACYNTGKVTVESGDAGTVAGTQEDANGAIEACYWSAVSGGVSDAVGSAAELSIVEAWEFGAGAWPAATDTNWDGTFWKSLGGWNGGSPLYPTLIWE